MRQNKKTIAVIGAGFSGLVAASLLAKNGYKVKVYEKNQYPGGRCNIMEEKGFRFDMGPSWYWMPDVFEAYFARFGKKPSDFYDLIRLDPSYKVFFPDTEWNIPAKLEDLQSLFEKEEPGSGEKLKKFLDASEKKYNLSMKDLVYKPALNWSEFINFNTIVNSFKHSLFLPFSTYINKYFQSSKIRKIMEFPVLFLGAKPSKTPSLYSIMNYADTQLGTWYPMGGMFEVSKAIEKLALQNGVEINYNSDVKKIEVKNEKATSIIVNDIKVKADIIVSSADYEFTERVLLDSPYRNYSKKNWASKQMSPSCLLFYWGVSKKIEGLEHHNLFFDEDFEAHTKAIYDDVSFPEKPLFYVCCPSKTDETVAPKGKENLFILIPISAGLKENPKIISDYKKLVLQRLENRTKTEIEQFIEVEKSFTLEDFISVYNSFKGNAYGLANTLKQTAVFRPKIINNKVDNLFYCGQLSVPGPGLPPAIISGTIVADYIHKNLN